MCIFTPIDSLKITDQQSLTITSGHFESVSSQIFHRLVSSSEVCQDRLLFEYLFGLFDRLDLKLNNKANIMKQNQVSAEDLQPMGLRCKGLTLNCMEPFMIKMKCFMQSLQLLQGILRIEKVYFVNRRIESLKIDSSSDSDE